MSIKHTNGFVRYELTEQDLEILSKTELEHGESDVSEILNHRMCVMQAVSMLTTESDRDFDAEQARFERFRELERRCYKLDDEEREEYDQLEEELGSAYDVTTYSDHPICVSETITEHAIALNDSCNDEERQQLKELIPLFVGTCPIKRVPVDVGVYSELRDRDEAYRELEQRRLALLEPVFRYGSFDEKLAALRQAAELV